MKEPLLSLAAVGDTGEPYAAPWALAAPLVVGRAVAEEDARQQLDALIFLGDNFYPHGLRQESLRDQIADSLVRPYCRFSASSAALWPLVAGACRIPPQERRPIPIHAVLGNHDYQSAESPSLQRSRLPLYVSNWSVREGPVEVVELTDGVSLVLFDSELILERMVMGGASPDPLIDGLRRSRGPWRIVAAHRPIATEPQLAYSKVLRRVFQEAGVEAHVFLSGHEHGLQVLRMDSPVPALHLVSGAGSSARSIPDKGQLFAASALGFVRIDLGKVDGEERLFASVHTASPFPGALWGDTARYGCWQVGRTGQVSSIRPGG